MKLLNAANVTPNSEKLYNRIKRGLRKWVILSGGEESEYRKIKAGATITIHHPNNKKSFERKIAEVERMPNIREDLIFVMFETEEQKQ